MQRRRSKSIIYTVIGSISLLVILIVLIVYTKENRFVTYKDPKGRFTIKYPVHWTVEENTGGTAVIFLSPQENDIDFFKENVNIVVQDISSNPMGIKKYSETAIMQMEVVFGDNLTVKKSEPTTIDGRVGYKYAFNGKGEGVDLGYKSVWTIDKLRAFQITYTSLTSQYENYLKQVDKMIKSFKIK